ncbi:MAG: peptidoglycan-binding protein [Christensenellaceae bacterium]|jgi:peptidoglycan hydrolase-like protein with peptidoglycan-binding domain
MRKRITIGIIVAMLLIAIFPASALAVERHEVLQIGDEDEWVRELQEKLYELEYLKVGPTGYFGTNTQRAVLDYQNDSGLSSDGKAGPLTRKALLGDAYADIDNSRVVNNTYQQEGEPAQQKTQTEADGQDTTIGSLGLSPGDKGDEIAKLQTRLKELEYYDYGSITGYYGPVTQESVKKFQRTHGLTADGVMNASTMEVLNSGSARYYTMYPGDRSDDIRAMQDRLRELGYFSASSTGYYGPITLSAVQMFQEANGLVVDGKAGKNTRGVLFSDTAVAASGGAAAPAASQQQQPAAEQQPAPEQQQQPATEQQPEAEQQPAPEQQQTVEQPPAAEQPAPAPSAPSGSIDKLMEVANSQLGKGYTYGSNGPSTFDCSGFVYYSLKNSGFATSRMSSAGYSNVSAWTSVPDMNSLQVGDIVFFKSDKSSVISHSGIYMGGGSFIHSAPSSGGVAISTMTSGYYNRNYVSAKRIV